jgi:alkylation response protein AidB-like acyl-CoA dehydrogenase
VIDPGFVSSDERSLFRSGVRDHVSKRLTLRYARAEHDGKPLATRALWTELSGSLDLLGLSIPVEYGGSGMSRRETALVFEEFVRDDPELGQRGG